MNKKIFKMKKIRKCLVPVWMTVLCLAIIACAGCAQKKYAGNSSIQEVSEKTENSWNIIYQTEKIKDFRLIMEISPKSKDSIFRFRYRLQSEQCVHMTKSHGNSQPCYFSCKQMDLQGVWNEIQFAQFLPNIHSFIPQKKEIGYIEECFGKIYPGPILECETKQGSIFMAYEHGAEYPNHYLHFCLDGDTISLCGTKGNYYNGENFNRKI